MRDSESRFADSTPVAIERLELTLGELRALVDDPVMLVPDHPGMFYANTKRAAIRKLSDWATTRGLL